MRRFLFAVGFGFVGLLAASSAQAAPSSLSPAAYTTITQMYALAGDFETPDEGAGAALRSAVCDQLPGAAGDRQAQLVLDDCFATADILDPMLAALQCNSPACVREPATAALSAIRRTYRAEATLARTVSGACHDVLAGGARDAGRVAAAWRRVVRAAQAGSQRGVVRGIFAFVDASTAGAGIEKRLPACAPPAA